jgi:hypothetical protein
MILVSAMCNAVYVFACFCMEYFSFFFNAGSTFHGMLTTEATVDHKIINSSTGDAFFL